MRHGPPPDLAGRTLWLLARAEDRPAPPGRAPYERAAPMLEAALAGAPRDPALLPSLAAALGRLGRVAREG